MRQNDKLGLDTLLKLIGCTNIQLNEEIDEYEYTPLEPEKGLFPAAFSVVCGSRHVKGYITFKNGKYQSEIGSSSGFELLRKQGPYVYIMSISEILSHYHLSIRELSERFYIPYRTVQNWNMNEGFNARKCPEYIRRMMIEILERKA